MIMKRTIMLIALASACLLAPALSGMPAGQVAYPQGYRQWVHIRSALIGAANPAFATSGGIHHIYANEKAMEGYRTGKFPDGSILVADFLETRENPAQPGITTEGARRRIDVMMKDSKQYAETGGWGFEQFKGDSQTERLVTAEGAAKCFACHSTQKGTDAVFSKFRP